MASNPLGEGVPSELTVEVRPVPLDEVATCLEELYGIKCQVIEPLGGESDRNYHVIDRNGSQYVCKIAHPSADENVLTLESQVLQHLEKVAPRLPLQRVTPTRYGCYFGRFESDLDSAIVRVYTYLEGVPMHSAPPTQAVRRSLGVLHGELIRALAMWCGPQPFRDLLWDLSRVERVLTLLPHVIDEKKRQLASYHLEQYVIKAKMLQDQLPRQLIHGDLNPFNLLMDRQATEIVGVLDFGDVNSAPAINDVAIAASYLMSASPQPLNHVCEYLEGYCSVQPLLPGEVEILFPLITARLAMTLVITEWRAALHPGNRIYILKNNLVAWTGLRQAARLSETQARQRLAQAAFLQP